MKSSELKKFLLGLVLTVLGWGLSAWSFADTGSVFPSADAVQRGGEPIADVAGQTTVRQETEGPYQYFENLFSIAKFKEHLQQFQQSSAYLPKKKEQIWQNLTGQEGWKILVRGLALLVAILLVAWGGEKAVMLKLNRVRSCIATQQSSEWAESLSFLLLHLVCSFAGLLAFTVITIICLSVMTDSGERMHILLCAPLSVILLVRCVAICAHAVLAPHASGIRLLNLDSAQALRFYRWVIAFTLLVGILKQAIGFANYLHIDLPLVAALRVFIAVLLNIMVMVFLVRYRQIIQHLFLRGKEHLPSSPFQENFSQVWLSLVLLIIGILLGLYIVHTFTGNRYLARQLAVTWWILIAFPVVDRLMFSLLLQLKKIPQFQSRTSDTRLERFIQHILFGERLIFFLVAMAQFCKGLGLNVFAMFRAGIFEKIIFGSIKIAILLFLAYLCWEFIQSLIEQRLPDEPMDFTDLESEGGHGGASRAETLLPLVRYFFAITLVVVVVFSVLDILGIKIMPLVASAGVIGIAIGFGAQKLVQDIISGFFFLLDDAFRLGEYIEAGGMRGTVERISVRSMRLRHHRGAIQTIPYSEISTVSNQSRDWVTMKLEIRLPYDTDPERVRRIVKKLGQRMLENEEYGKNFILPLKSQGVTRVEESALIFRVKFTSKPGEQWVLRRESYRLVKEALEKEGIHFAHRAVHVITEDGHERGEECVSSGDRMAPSSSPSRPGVQAAASAAALAATVQHYDRMDEI